MASGNVLISLLGGIWRGVDVFRRVIHLFIMLLVFLFVLAVFSTQAPQLPQQAALVLAPEGAIVEQLDGDPLSRALDELSGNRLPQTLQRDLLDAIGYAAEDDRIRAIAIDLESFTGAGLSKLRRLGRALDAFRESGKTVVAYSDFMTQAQYYLAAHADEVYLHPSGAVFLDGYGRFRTYYRDAIDKLLIDWHVFKVGDFKSFLEPYTRNDMSPEDRLASHEWLAELWRFYQVDIESARGLAPGSVGAYANELVTRMQEGKGDLAQIAVDAGLVDELRNRDQVRSRMITLAGEDRKNHTYKQVAFDDYVAIKRSLDGGSGGAPYVGVIVASGQILDGEQPPGEIGGDTLARLIKRARFDDDVKAVVLQVDSGGGSKFASEIIQREIQLLREEGKPVIASMSSVAASGGYWISMSADEIWANPSTITGSIGIGAAFPTFSRSLDWLGVNVDGVGTTRWSGQFRPDRDLGDDARELIQLSIEHGYRQFVNGVAEARSLTVEQVESAAGGRVWTGERAHELRLVDVLGDLDQAIESAAQHAALDDYSVRYIEKKLTTSEALALQLATRASVLLGDRVRASRSAADELIDSVRGELERLANFNDPGNLYWHCFCDIF